MKASNFYRRGEDSPNWKGGRKKDAHGYIVVLLQPDDFFYPMVRKDGYVKEHRLVVAKHINRCLLPWEIVHHKNSIRDDNQIENLELLSGEKYHIIDSIVKQYIRRLEGKVDKLLEGQRELRAETRLLRFENKQLKEKYVGS